MPRSANEFRLALERADRSYEYSDDFSVYERGRDYWEALRIEAKSSPEKQEVYNAFFAGQHQVN